MSHVRLIYVVSPLFSNTIMILRILESYNPLNSYSPKVLLHFHAGYLAMFLKHKQLQTQNVRTGIYCDCMN